MSQVIILVGPMAGGKTEATRALKDAGFIPFSLSQIVRKEAGIRRGMLPIDLLHEEIYADIPRQALQEASSHLRSFHGEAVLAEIMVRVIREQLQNGKLAQDAHIVVEGVRSKSEVETLQNELGALAIGVTASAEIRWQRLRARNRPGDPQTREEFDRMDAYEWQRVGESLTLCASNVIDNSQLTLQEARVTLFSMLGIPIKSPEGQSSTKENK